jgi:hypothetical protein
MNGGQSWEQISPDLTRTDSIVPSNVGKYSSQPAAKARHPGVIYTIAPSYVDANVIWTGSDDGLIHVTFDGGRTWKDVTPPELRARPWSKISLMDAGRHDRMTAYAAVNTFRLDDLRPHIWRTHDGGQTWQHVTNGIPDGAITNVVREDPVRRGLLFVGTELAVHVSFDDGDHWQSLRLNMPATSIRDLVIKDNDIAVGTHGRSFWILDDIAPLRQINATLANADVHLFRPSDAWRVRWNQNTDTPLPQEEPGGQNPPDGAIIDYVLRTRATGPVTLEILDAQGEIVRRFASDDPVSRITDVGNVPAYWIRPPQILSAAPGAHRFVWDLRWAPPAGATFSYPIAATFRNTAPEPKGPWVHPATYTVRLTVNGQRHEQPLTVKMDPRVKTPEMALRRQYDNSLSLYRAINSLQVALAEIRSVRSQLAALPRTNDPLARTLSGFDARASALAGQSGGRGAGGGTGAPSLSALNGQLASLLDIIQDADVDPTTQVLQATQDRVAAARSLLDQWTQLKQTELSALNRQLSSGGLPVIDPGTPARR